jgi:hypothetical protein
MHPDEANLAQRGLGKIFWGTLICVFDFHISQTSNGSGFRFDLINDVVGTVLIAWGVGQLQGLVKEPQYRQIMRFCHVMAILCILDALRDHVIAPWPAPLEMLFIVFGFVCLLAIYQFCTAMRIFCYAGGMPKAERSWSTSQRLFLVLNLIPAAIMNVLALIVAARGTRINFNVGPLAIVVVIAAFIPLVHLLWSIWATRRDLDGRARLAKFI